MKNIRNFAGEQQIYKGDSIKEIDKEQRTKDNEDGEFYDIQGRKVTELQKGLNIIRYSDGTTRKVIQR